MTANARRRSRRHSEIDDEELAHSPSTVRSSASPEVRHPIVSSATNLIKARPEKRQRTRNNSDKTTTNASVEDDELDEGIEFGADDDDDEEEDDEDEDAIAATQREMEQRKRDREAGVDQLDQLMLTLGS